MNIRKRFLKELFEDKKVAFQPELYRMYFHKTFPDSEEFVTFLMTSSEQKRLESAMKIMDRINFSSNFPIVEDIYANLVRLESENLSGKDDSYVGQDHFVHTVNLYILGVYLFFNHPVFHRSLSNYFFDRRLRESDLETRNQLMVKTFLSTWKYYVCSHDIGYPFESLVDSDGKIKESSFRSIMQQYSNLREYQLYNMAVKVMAKLLYCLYLFQNATHSLAESIQGDRELLDGQWLDWNDPRKPHDSLWGAIQKSGCSHYLRLEFIQSYEGIKALMPLIEWENVALLIRDADGEPVVLNYFSKNNECTWLHKDRQVFNQTQMRNIRLFGSDEFPTDGYSCTYYVQNPMSQLIKQLKEISVDAYYDDWNTLAAEYFDCRHEMFVDMSHSESASDSTIYKVYRDILRRFPHSRLNKGFLNLWKEEYKGGISPKLQNQIFNIIVNAIQDINFQDVPKTEWREHIEDKVSETLKESWDALFGEGTLEDRLSNEMQSLNVMINLLYSKLKGAFQESPELISLRTEKDGMEPSLVQCDLLGATFSGTKSMEAGLYKDFLDQLDKKLHIAGFLKAGQHMPDFLRYHQTFSCFDHGVMSATLLLSTVVNYCSVAKRLVNKNSLFLLAWDIDPQNLVEKLEKKSQQVLIEAIYTMMLHNLYPSVYWLTVGNELSHSLAKNPFTYFGLLCDALQMWDRVQQIKPAERSLDFPLEGNNFDLRIHNNHICLVIPLSCIEKVKKKCLEWGNYLLGADELFLVSGIADLPPYVGE